MDSGQPGSHQDIWCMKKCVEKFKWNTCTKEDIVITDGRYRTLEEYGVETIFPIRKSPRKELNKDQLAWNDRIHTVQKRIERIFGALKTKFVLLRRPFHGTERRHSEIVQIALVIYNKEKRIVLNLPHIY